MKINNSGVVGCAALSLFAALLGSSVATAQEVSDTNPNQTVSITLAESDKLAAVSAASAYKQFLPPKFNNGKPVAGKRGHPQAKSDAGTSHWSDDDNGFLPKPGYFVTDVTYNGGAVVTDAINYPVYVNTKASVVGYPGAFLHDLGKSDMVHVIDQYVGLSGDKRYKAGIGAALSYPTTPSVALQDDDITAIVHAAAAHFGHSGYHAVYHIFLAPGQDVCSEGIGCYSPDNLANFGFCAYHYSLDFSDVGHVLYSVEPFQAVPECQTGPPSPNGLVADSTMNTLSHEYFETISDPDGDAWYNVNSLDENGSEIADICVTTSTLYPIVKLNGTKYELQGEYSNKYHGCSFAP